jgi:hypothetical protein
MRILGLAIATIYRNNNADHYFPLVFTISVALEGMTTQENSRLAR